MRRCTWSHFGLICAFKKTAQVHSKSLWAHTSGHFARKYAYILHGTLKHIYPCTRDPQKPVCFRYFAYWGYWCLWFRMWGSALLNYAYILHGVPKTHACVPCFCVFVATVWLVGRGFAPRYAYILHGTLKNMCAFLYFCVLVYTFLSVGPCFAHTYANILHGNLENMCSFHAIHIHGGIQTQVICIVVSLVKYQHKLHLQCFHTHFEVTCTPYGQTAIDLRHF